MSQGRCLIIENRLKGPVDLTWTNEDKELPINRFEGARREPKRTARDRISIVEYQNAVSDHNCDVNGGLGGQRRSNLAAPRGADSILAFLRQLLPASAHRSEAFRDAHDASI